MLYLSQDNHFVIYTNSAQQAVFNNIAVTFNKQLTVPSIILKPLDASANENFIGYTNTTKLTNSIALKAGYTLRMSFSTSVAGTYSFDAQLRLEWVVGTALWNQVISGISLSSTCFDADWLYGAFERNPRMDATRGTDCLTTRRVLYMTSSTAVYWKFCVTWRCEN